MLNKAQSYGETGISGLEYDDRIPSDFIEHSYASEASWISRRHDLLESRNLEFQVNLVFLSYEIYNSI